MALSGRVVGAGWQERLILVSRRRATKSSRGERVMANAQPVPPRRAVGCSRSPHINTRRLAGTLFVAALTIFAASCGDDRPTGTDVRKLPDRPSFTPGIDPSRPFLNEENGQF